MTKRNAIVTKYNPALPPIEEVMDKNDPDAFKPGQVVRILGKYKTKPVGWGSTWVGPMDAAIGKKGIILRTEYSLGFEVQVAMKGEGQRVFWFPSCCLELVGLVKPKKRVRVGPGPWDAAPCTHLRWNLMGFFREKLVLVKGDGGPVEMKVRCTKCNTEMTLRTQ